MKIQLTKNKEVYNYCKPYVIAEIGANHNGDMELAKEMIDSAKKCGADAVKFQSWTNKSLIAEIEYENNQVYDDNPKKHWGSLKEMVTKYSLSKDQHLELKLYCDKVKIDFCSTPFSLEEADLLRELNVPFFKIASMDINNLSLLKHVASFHKPIVISTGMSSLSEIEKAISVIESAENNQIAILHCISIYPPEYRDINLNNISMLSQTFNYPVGFSDHSFGYAIPLAAVALGACIIEKHFTTDKDLPGWDHAISADEKELEIIIKESINISDSLGSHQRIVSKAEEEKKIKFRRSIVAKNNIKTGSFIKLSDLDFKRPGIGIRPDEYSYVVGRKASKDIKKDQLIKWDDL